MRKRQGQHVVELLNALAAELRAGLPARTALIRAAEQFDSSTAICMCPVAASAARLAADVPAALRMDARINGLPVLTSLAAIWQVGEQSGASLADAVARLARSSAEARTVTLSLSAELAGARATARILAGLPVIGIVLGNALGASPIEWLTSGPIGLTVLTLGLAFEAVGLWWSSRIVRGVARQAAGL